MAELYDISGKQITNAIERTSPYMDIDEGESHFRVPVVIIAEGQLHQLADLVAERILPEVLPLLHEQLELPL